MNAEDAKLIQTIIEVNSEEDEESSSSSSEEEEDTYPSERAPSDMLDKNA